MFRSCLFFLCFTISSAKSWAQQNTVLIIADDVGTDYFGFSPDAADTAIAPHLGELARSGLVFSRAWTNPVCSPTRAGIITGRYAFRTGVGSVISGMASPQLDTAEMTLPRLLLNHAPVRYATANIGKWHLHSQQPIVQRLYPNRLGYELYSGNFNGGIPDYYNWNRIQNGQLDTVTVYATTQTINDAIAWLDTLDGTRPFFLWLAFNAPHKPYHKPPDSLISTTGLPGTPVHIANNPVLYYKAAIEAMDTEVGRLLFYLDQQGLRDSTNVVFIGDNGSEPDVAQITDTTRSKGTLFEYGIHVPFFVSGPAVSDPGRVSTALVSTPDIFATVLEISGFDNWLSYIPSTKLPIDSKSLLPIIKNDTSQVRDWVFTEQFQSVSVPRDGKAIRNHTFKLTRFDNGNERFHDLLNDPGEQLNLLGGVLTTGELLEYRSLCTVLDSLLNTSVCSVSGLSEIHGKAESKMWISEIIESTLIEVRCDDLPSHGVRLHDIHGRFIRKGPVGIWDVSFLDPGMYVFSMEHSGRLFSTRWIKH
jgi:arylsulfatase A-like enzyme